MSDKIEIYSNNNFNLEICLLENNRWIINEGSKPSPLVVVIDSEMDKNEVSKHLLKLAELMKRQAFVDHLDRASKEVSTWPRWAQKVFG